jgi:putative oxidoreductase
MTRDKTRQGITLILRWYVGLVFIYAAAGKIWNPGIFAADIDNYRLLPYLLVTLMAAVLPWVELICGLLLVAGRRLQGASLVVIAMNVVFILAIGSAMIRGLDITCGCFAVTAEGARIGIARLLEDIFLLSATAMIYVRSLGGEATNRDSALPASR